MPKPLKPEPTVIAQCRNALGEAPVWCPRDRSIWWIDAREAMLWTSHAVGGAAQSWKLPKLPASLARFDDDQLLIAFRSGLAMLERGAESLRWIDLPDLALGDERFNDIAVDRRGTLWLGTLDRELRRPVGGLYRLGEDARLQRADHGFALSNGIGFSPDGATLFFSETHERKIYRYVVDASAASVSGREVFADLSRGEGAPDGLTVDAEGGIWVAIFDGGCLHRYRPDGSLDRVVPLPVSRPTSCAFGGPQLQTLFVTTASFGLTPDQHAAQPLAGALLAFAVPQRGIAEPPLTNALLGFAGPPVRRGQHGWPPSNDSRQLDRSHA